MTGLDFTLLNLGLAHRKPVKICCLLQSIENPMGDLPARPPPPPPLPPTSSGLLTNQTPLGLNCWVQSAWHKRRFGGGGERSNWRVPKSVSTLSSAHTAVSLGMSQGNITFSVRVSRGWVVFSRCNEFATNTTQMVGGVFGCLFLNTVTTSK